MRKTPLAHLASAIMASLALVVSVAPAAQAADPTPAPSPSGQEVPQPSSCAQYSQHVPSFVYAGQTATMTVTIERLHQNSQVTPVGAGADGSPISFSPSSASVPDSANGDSTMHVPFTFTPSDTSTVNIKWTDHCTAEAVGQQDRSGSTAPSTIRVVQSAPPSGPPCGAPDMYSVQSDRAHVAAGAGVTLTVSIRTRPCYGMESGPHDFTVVGRTPGQTSTYPYELIGQGQTNEYGRATVTATPSRNTEYALLNRPGPTAVVTVDRTAGTCAGQVTSAAPASAPLGSVIRLSGHAPAGYDVSINLRRRGQTAFTARQVTADTAGNWTTTLRLDEDYRYYASTSMCDSPPRLALVRPTISGPAVVHRGSTVTLTVAGLPTAPVAVFFHMAGTTGYAKRRLSSLGKSGTFTTTYAANADYRYYAVVGNDHRISNPGLTQIR